VYSIYVDDDGKAAGGSTILRDSILHSYVNLDTDLQAVAVCISLDKTITLCSVLLPPNSLHSLAQLKNLADQLPTPFIIVDDFNEHNLYGIVKQPMTKAKNWKTLSLRRDCVSLTTVLIHICILGMGLIQLLILLLLLHHFF
jgi:hypothetical protein